MSELHFDNNLLCIIMEFPPFSSAGVFRPLRFLNGLVEKGIQPIVLTFEFDDQLKNGVVKQDFELMDKVDERIIVYRIPLKDMNAYKANRSVGFLSTFFNLSDNFAKAWEDNLFNILPGIIQKHQPKKLFVTAPPFSSLMLAKKVSEKYNLDLYVDMRDAWAKLSMIPSGSYLHYIYKKHQERSVFKHSKAVITVTPQLKKMFEETHPGIPKDKFQLIYNGIDNPGELNTNINSTGIDSSGTYNIGYTGSFYYSPESRLASQKKWWKKKGHRKLQYTPVKEDWLYRSPYFFFRTLQALFKKQPVWRKKLYFHLIGDTPDWLRQMTIDFEVQDNTILHGFQPMDKAIALEKSFNALLTTSEKVLDNPHYCLPSKLFTYLKSGRPIIGFVTDGIQSEFIKEANAGVVIDPDNLTKAVEKLEDLLNEGFNAKADLNYLDKYSTKNAIDQLAAILDG